MGAKLPTIYSSGDEDAKAQNQALKQQVEDLKAKIVHLEGQLVSSLKSKPKGVSEEKVVGLEE